MKRLLRFILIVLLISSDIYTVKSMADEGTAGTVNIFSVGGVGARALGLGNAYVALPMDATAVYWNPAGMEYIEKKNISVFYTNLLEGTQYNFVGYVHPIINVGTLGAGIIRVGTDFNVRDNHNVSEGSSSYQESQFILSFAKQIPFNLAVGVNLKLHYFSLWNNSDTGIGADLGMIYKPNFGHVIFQDMSFGMNFHNIMQPSLKPLEETDVLPFNFKFGMAKPIRLNSRGGQITLFLDFDQAGGNSSFRYHTGTEYVFNDRAMLRLGINNSQLAFGAGVKYSDFQFDYSFGKFAEHELNSSHRISISFSFGKDREELIQIAERRKLDEIDKQVAQKIEWERNAKIARAFENAKRYMDDEDYLRAQREYNIIISYENEIPDAIEIREAKEMLAVATQKYKDQMEKALAEIQARNAMERKKEEDRIYINDHFKKGLSFYENEEFDKAIDEWEKILERDPNNQLAQEHIKKAQVDYNTMIYSLIKRADALGRQGKYVEAINVLNQAIGLNPAEDQIRSEISQRRSRYENKLNFYDLYQQGRNYQIRKDYQRAMEAFERALVFDPYHEEVKQRYEEVKARANAKREPLTGEMKSEFLRSLKLMNEGKYKEALEILESLRIQQPYNKDILDGIDSAREQLERQQRK
ncbi:PorV/PorQ family protein [candidate division KSB1 bacterium]|nr:PorV/PorQ family protein [candidate division KSB1 bacterium]